MKLKKKGGQPALVTMKHAAAGTPGRYKKRGEQTESRAQTDSRPIAIKESTAFDLQCTSESAPLRHCQAWESAQSAHCSDLAVGRACRLNQRRQVPPQRAASASGGRAHDIPFPVSFGTRFPWRSVPPPTVAAGDTCRLGNLPPR